MARRMSPPHTETTVDETEVVRERPYDVAPVRRRDRIRWGPVIAGLLTALVTLVVLTVLGVAIGLSAFDPGDEGIGTAATIWGIIATLIAFFAGGVMAARTAADPTGTGGTLNGFMVGVTAIAVMIWLVGAGAGNLLGAAAGNLGEMTQLGGIEVTQEEAQGAFDTARDSAWGTLIALLLALGAATVGGLVGHRGDAVPPERERPRR